MNPRRMLHPRPDGPRKPHAVDEAGAAQSVSGGGSGGSGPPLRLYNHLRVGPGVLPHGLHYGSPGLIRARYSREVRRSLIYLLIFLITFLTCASSRSPSGPPM